MALSLKGMWHTGALVVSYMACKGVRLDDYNEDYTGL